MKICDEAHLSILDVSFTRLSVIPLVPVCKHCGCQFECRVPIRLKHLIVLAGHVQARSGRSPYEILFIGLMVLRELLNLEVFQVTDFLDIVQELWELSGS